MVKCSECKQKIIGHICYLNTKKYCSKCFSKKREENKLKECIAIKRITWLDELAIRNCLRQTNNVLKGGKTKNGRTRTAK